MLLRGEQGRHVMQTCDAWIGVSHSTYMHRWSSVQNMYDYIILICTWWYCSINYVMLYYITLYYIILYHIILYYILLYYIILYYIILYYSILYYSIVYDIVVFIILYHLILYIYWYYIYYIYIDIILYYIAFYYMTYISLHSLHVLTHYCTSSYIQYGSMPFATTGLPIREVDGREQLLGLCHGLFSVIRCKKHTLKKHSDI